MDVARYYDSNTLRFLLVGRGRGAHTIHRELWGPGVASAAEAARYIDTLVADEIAALSPDGPRSLVDFGCGVGGTLLYLAQRFPDADLRGMTISGKQAEVGARLARNAGVDDRCSVVLGDFHRDQIWAGADAVVAIESLAHSHDLAAALANAARHLAPRGAFLVADDFLAVEEASLGTAERKRVGQLREGWRVPGIGTVERVAEIATRQGLSLLKDRDLSRYVRPGSRMRDRLVALCSPLLDRLGLARVPLYGNMIGGNALQIGLKEGFIRYRLLVFGRGVAGS